MAKGSGQTEHQRRAWGDWLYHEVMEMDDIHFDQFQNNIFDLVETEERPSR